MGYENKYNRIIVLVGKSACGKDSLAKLMADRYPELKKPISTTSRPIREGETDGVDYFFVAKKEFVKKIKENGFWEHVSYKAYKKDVIEEWFYGLEKTKSDLFNDDFIIPADLPRLRQLKKRFGKKVVAVYIDVPVDQRRNRAITRDKNFNIIEWERRVSDENYVFENIEEEVDYVVENGVLEECLKQIEHIYKWHA